MKAAYIETQGGPEVIQVGDLPCREPGPGEVRVRVRAASVNPIDLYIRAGSIPMPVAFPYVVGCDFAGEIDQVGPGVSGLKVGERVWGSNQGLLGRPGCTSEFAIMSQDWAYPTVASQTDAEAAAMALVGITAHLGLVERAGLAPGESLFVSGGSGGVGTMVIQMAKALGARVATTASSDQKAAMCRELGADLVMNYKTDDLGAGLREFSEEGLDVWFETQREPDLDLIVPLMRKRGRIVVMAGRAARPVLPLGPFYTRNASMLGFAMFNFTAGEQRRCAEQMNRWVSEGKLKAVVAKTFPLAETADAHRFLEESTLGGAGRVVGKVVITVP